MKKYRQIVALFLLMAIASSFMLGCESITYYSQSISGHTRLMMGREPISKWLPSADEALKQRLITAREIRDYAISELSLPDNKSYTSYVQLKQHPPIWNVVAAEEFSLQAKSWCYPIVGCASYRGYFSRKGADHYAEKMRAQGYDVAVVGASAYSTLGWFSDPLTSAMLDRRDDASLADLIFHELAHQQLYIKGNSRFNEAFATTVGEQGALQWLQATDRQALLNQYQLRLGVKDDFLSIVYQAKEKLSALYAEDISDEEKRAAKKSIFEWMRFSHQEFTKNKWDNKAWYGRWFEQPINNARLAAIGTYRDMVPDFVELFYRCDKNFERFYREVERRSERVPVVLHGACG